MPQNPLAIEPVTPMSPMKAHALLWQYVNSLSQDQLEQMANKVDYILPIFGRLAGNPEVTASDVISAASEAETDGKIEPGEGISFIQQIPTNPDAVGPWLRTLYAVNLAGAVHLKASLIQRHAATQEVVVQEQSALGVQDTQLALIQHPRLAEYQALVPLLLTKALISHTMLTTALGRTEASGISTQPIIADIMKAGPQGDGAQFDAILRAQIVANSQSNSEAAVGEVTPQSTTIH